MKKKLTLTVGIPTCYGGGNIIETVKSIHNSRDISKFDFKIVADSVPIEKKLLKKIKSYGVSVTENSVRGSQNKKYKQIIASTTSDIIVLTQDDVLFQPDTLQKISEVFRSHPDVTMVGVHIAPTPPHTWFEKIIEIGIIITQKIGEKWNKGDNYLLSNGRCLAFKTEFLKKLTVVENIVNGDAYYYFENKRHGGVFYYLSDAVVYNKSPLYLSEHLSQSSRFQFSYKELKSYFGNEVKHQYEIPYILALKATLDVFWQRPVHTLLYGCILAYTSVVKYLHMNSFTPLWRVDLSTKRV